MADKTWKAYERRLARLFGTNRIPAAGWGEGQQLEAPDFETLLVSFQAKKGYSQPGYLKTWLDGICRVAAGRARYGAVVWAGKGARDADSLVVMRAADFRHLLSDLERITGPRRPALPPLNDTPDHTPPGSTSDAA